ncbi:LPD25 domain-containing protein [Gracilibacillus salinarum]|uniref:ArdC-like ssDNA-binding domain-containing protein n=1 Tax=Gracilibacillus salinarum TaxID=2932255 RepID=A0ABY4GII9_9BACI|nr:LPD25 domain-containing protein [Gracilibacillus salinarum]UOQ84018.1 ArdC-like ssDNA-binding domain-containing protein [Gracilibacillus salinarum]
MKRKTFEQKQEEVKQLTETMDHSIESYFETPEQMAEHLAFMMQFYQYSLRNTALIQSQFKGAQAVGSYKFWQEKDFQVQKGEKAIQILVPNKTQPKFKNENGKWKSIKKATEQEKELLNKGELEEKASGLYFGKGSVFDVSQTNAKASDLPDIFPNRWLEGNVASYQNMLEALKKVGDKLDVTIGEPLEELGAAKGAFYQGINGRKNHIGLNPRNGELQNVKTLIHELAHAKLHGTTDKHFNLSSEEKEFQAEMTAYTVASYFDIDTSDYSLGYLANWTQGKELKDKAQLLEEVRGAAVEFIETMEPELMKEQEKGMENGKDVFIQAVHDRKDLSELTEVNKAAMGYVIDHKEEEHTKGLYYYVDGDVVVGVDNSTGEAWTEEFDHIVKCKAWLKRYDLDIEQPQIFIESTEAPELDSDSMMDFAKGNAFMEKLEERYQDDNRYYKTRYSIVFPKSKNSKMEVINMERLDVGDGEFLNPHHQARKEGNLTDEQQMMLDDAVYGHLLESERLDINDWLKGKNEKKKLQTVDMDMM